MASSYNPAVGWTGPNPAAIMHTPGFDLTKFINNDPEVMAWQTGHQRAVGTAGNQRRAAIQALALDYGGLPAGFVDAYGDLSPDILQQAAANPMSQQARLKLGYENAQAGLKRSLAARGALHSGELVQGLGDLGQANATDLYNAAKAFGEAAGGDINTFTGVEGDTTGYSTAIGDATTRQAALHPGAEGQDAKLEDFWYYHYGQPVYKADDGSLYSIGADGNLTPYTRPEGVYTDPATGLAMKTINGQGVPVDPTTGQPIDPWAGQPSNPYVTRGGQPVAS